MADFKKLGKGLTSAIAKAEARLPSSRVFKTSDGYTFKEMPDGRITDGDMTWPNAKEFMRDMPHAYQQGDDLGKRKAMIEGYGRPDPENLVGDISKFMPDDAQAQFLRALNKQNAPKPEPKLKSVKPTGGLGQVQANEAISKAAESAGMNAPVTANKDLTTLQDFHTSFGDSVRKRAEEMQKLRDSLPYKYDTGHYVFTEDSAQKNWPPMRVLHRDLAGNRIMREDPEDFLSKKIIDPATGRAMRTPYEPGYKVRLEHAPDNWSEFVIPESAIKGNVDMRKGGVLHMAGGGGKLGAGEKVMGALAKASKQADEILEAKKLEGTTKGGLNKILEAKQAPMTTPSGTGLPLMPRDQGMYTPREQKDLPRMPKVDAARAAGVSPKYTERMQDLLDSPTARKKVDKLINKGKDLNMTEWYGTEPLRQVAMDAGRTPEQFESLMAQLASASQRNPVDKQNQMGSYLYHLSETGQLPENSLLLTNKLKKALKTDPSLAEGRTLVELPTGYGSLAQGDIFNRAVMIGQGDIAGALPPNKKLGTFYENLLGNLKPVTVDVNAVRGPIIERGDPRWLTSKLVEKDEEGNIINSYKPREMFESGEMTMREAKQRPGFWEAAPSGSEYAGFEDLWQRGAKRHDVDPAEAQALGWYGSADVTALKTKPENYVDNLERLIRRTAEQTGQSPKKVMNDLVTGEGFLRKKGGAVNKTDGNHWDDPHSVERFHRKMAISKATGGITLTRTSLRKPKHMASGGISKLFGAFEKAEKAADKAMEAEKVLPKVDRLSMSYKDVTKRVPEVADALEQLMRGEITKAQYNDVVKMYKPVTPYAFVPKPASKEEAIGALRGDTAKSRYGMQSEYEPGAKVGLRLDIPAYTNKGVWVNSIHDQKAKKVAYGPVASVKNADLGISQAQSKKIALGGEKQPYARVVGDWNPMSEEEAVAKAQEYLNHPEWRQIGIDPERHSYFYDRHTMEPITNAEEVIQIGPLVLGKNPKYGKMEDFEYARGGITLKRTSLRRPKHFDGGGIAASDVTEGMGDAPPTKVGLMAELLAKMAKEQAIEEYDSYKKPRAVTDIANRGIVAPLIGLPVDLGNMALAGVDYIGTKATGKPIRLSSDKPFGGSEHIKDLMDKYNVTSGEDRPMTETALSMFSPTGMIKGAMGAGKGMTKAAEAAKSLFHTKPTLRRKPA